MKPQYRNDISPENRGIVKKLNIKGEEAGISAVYFPGDFGLKKDKDDFERQVSLMRHETLVELESVEEKGLCMMRFKGNIETLYLDYTKLKQGDRIQVGDLRVEVTSARKKCHGTECPAFKDNESCRMIQSIVFVKVVEPGMVAVSDHILTKPRV